MSLYESAIGITVRKISISITFPTTHDLDRVIFPATLTNPRFLTRVLKAGKSPF